MNRFYKYQQEFDKYTKKVNKLNESLIFCTNHNYSEIQKKYNDQDYICKFIYLE